MANAQLDPALHVTEGLISGDLEAQLLGVELQRAPVVACRDADELQLGDHRRTPWDVLPHCRVAGLAPGTDNRYSNYGYAAPRTRSLRGRCPDAGPRRP